MFSLSYVVKSMREEKTLELDTTGSPLNVGNTSCDTRISLRNELVKDRLSIWNDSNTTLHETHAEELWRSNSQYLRVLTETNKSR